MGGSSVHSVGEGLSWWREIGRVAGRLGDAKVVDVAVVKMVSVSANSRSIVGAHVQQARA